MSIRLFNLTKVLKKMQFFVQIHNYFISLQKI